MPRPDDARWPAVSHAVPSAAATARTQSVTVCSPSPPTNSLQYHPDPSRDAGVYNNPRFSQTFASDHSSMSAEKAHAHAPAPAAPAPTTTTVPQYLWDKDPDLDDALHNPDPKLDAKLDRDWTLFSARGWMNAGALVVIVSGLLMLFAGYPIFIQYSRDHPHLSGFNLGGINASGQIPDLPGIPRLIDAETPTSAYSRTGSDGKKYNLVFSDEFETDGRSFYPGDDPFWEAADLHYWCVVETIFSSLY